MSNSENNKRIFKNTLALYFRQIITMFVSLYTSRIVLQTLGVVDYGLNDVVGGVVAMLSFLTGSLSGTTQRFLSVELGKSNFIKMKQVFANSLSLHIILILLVIIIAETFGLWFLKNKLVIPPERANAAFLVYQFSVMSFSIGVFFAPFDGAIRTHEKFDFYARMSIFDVVARLVIVYLLTILPYDKLIAVSFMGMCVEIVGRIIVYVYCHKNFEECRIKFSWIKDDIRQLSGYNLYSTIGLASYIFRFYGLNIILNLYYGPVMNAAQGIANSVYAALSSFSDNAALATQPQIIMSYGQNNRQRLWDLISTSSRLYFYLLLILILPFVLETNTVLYIWLGNCPEYTPIFIKLFLLEALARVLGHPISFANTAVGKLRPVVINTVGCRLFILLFAVFIGANKLSPVYIYVFIVIIQVLLVNVVPVIIVLKIQIGFSLRDYFTDVVLSIMKTCLFTVSIPVILHYFLSKSIFSSCIVGVSTFMWSAIIVFFIGLKHHEKRMIVNRLPPSLLNILKIKPNLQ